LFLLPVAFAETSPWGDPLPEILEHDLHNRHSLICVMPSFTGMPWYADHPTDPRSQQERYFIEDVVPLVEASCSQVRGVDRLLLGFSKSGFGAFNLFLRHPGMFAKAAAWDAPLGMASINKYGSAEAFGTQANFDEYYLWEALKQNAGRLDDEHQLGLFGYDTFRGHMQATHYQMLKWGIPHHFVDGPRREHQWNSGWLPEVIEFLAGEKHG
jgi:S-formylglutathione hydrolase FrmB